jgi:hypothetical protein
VLDVLATDVEGRKEAAHVNERQAETIGSSSRSNERRE